MTPVGISSESEGSESSEVADGLASFFGYFAGEMAMGFVSVACRTCLDLDAGNFAFSFGAGSVAGSAQSFAQYILIWTLLYLFWYFLCSSFNVNCWPSAGSIRRSSTTTAPEEDFAFPFNFLPMILTLMCCVCQNCLAQIKLEADF